MKAVFAISLIILLAGCSGFNRRAFIEQGFGVDLSSHLESHQSKYIDGRLDVYGVSVDSSLYQQFFGGTQKFETSADIIIEGPGDGVQAQQVGELQYRTLRAFDGYTPVIVYAPKEKRMVFLYATGIL